jgi:hypothetical protein
VISIIRQHYRVIPNKEYSLVISIMFLIHFLLFLRVFSLPTFASGTSSSGRHRLVSCDHISKPQTSQWMTEDPQSMVQRLIWGTTILSTPPFQCVSLGSSATVDHTNQGYIELETPCAGSFTGAINELNGSKWWIFQRSPCLPL